MKRVVDVLYGLKGYPNAVRFTEFKTDLFANGSTPGITLTTCTTGISVGGTITNAIDVTAAATLTNFVKFNAVAGCVVASDVDPNETPSGGGIGCDGVITILIGSDTCYIPYFTALHNM